MNFTKVKDRFINSKSVGFTLLRGKKNTGKTLASIYRTMNLENNYCLYPEDKINSYIGAISSKGISITLVNLPLSPNI